MMPGIALLAPAPPARIVSRPALCVVLIILFGALLRAPMLGDPSYKIDEEFYLLVGNRMLHGALPYVDIWDRKPIGLFLIYAFAALFGEGPVPYQLLATASAIGTALCIFAIGRPIAGKGPATVSALLYLLWLEMAEGGGGQAQVFHGLPVAMAAWLLMRPEDDRARRRAYAAMLLIGIAIQIKYTVIFEGAFFGLVAAIRAFRRDPAIAPRETLLLALTALAPTLLAIGAFAAIGHLRVFWFANFTSIFLRAPTPPADLWLHAETVVYWMIPFALSLIASVWALRHDGAAHGWLAFMLGWCCAAAIGFGALGVLYSHYLLPVFIPVAAVAAPAFRRLPAGPALAALCAWLPVSQSHWPDLDATPRSQAQMAALAALVPGDVSRGCLQMFDGPPILYHLTHACTVSRFLFPDHLSAAIEAHAIGIDPVAEVRRILRVGPEVITISDVNVRPPDRATFAVMRAGLARDYRYVGRSWVDERYISVFRHR